MNIFQHGQEAQGWIQRQSLKKISNAFHVWSSFQQSKYRRTPITPSFPLSVSIEPTTSCNLRCPECPSGLRSFTRPTGNISNALFQNIIDELSPWLTNLTFYFQGEPFLHPQFLDMVSYAAERGIYQTTSTNAHYLNEHTAQKVVRSGMDRIIISIDGFTQEVYEQYRRGGQLSKVLEGTSNLIKARKELKSRKPFIVFQFLVVRPNEHQISEIKSLARSMGVDAVKFKTAQIYDYENGSDLIPTQEKYSRYQQTESGSWKIKSGLENNCWKMWSSSVITWDGRVLPCCFDKDGKYVMGNLQTQSFQEIWMGENYNQFRTSILNSRRDIDICRNCTEGLKVWA